MSAKETPLATVKRLYGNKDKLIETVSKALSDLGEQSEGMRERLRSASNKKLLRLAEATKEVKEKYGSKDKLIAALTSAMNKAKDNDFVNRLSDMSLTRLLDLMRTAEAQAKKLRRRSEAA